MDKAQSRFFLGCAMLIVIRANCYMQCNYSIERESEENDVFLLIIEREIILGVLMFCFVLLFVYASCAGVYYIGSANGLLVHNELILNVMSKFASVIMSI